MKWSWKLTRLAGIDVYVHATFFILIAWLGLSYWQVEGSLAAVITGSGMYVASSSRLRSAVFSHSISTYAPT